MSDVLMDTLLQLISEEQPTLQFGFGEAEQTDRGDAVRYPVIEVSASSRGIFGPPSDGFMLAFSHDPPPLGAEDAPFPFARFTGPSKDAPWTTDILTAENIYAGRSVTMTVYTGKLCKSSLPADVQIAFIKAVKILRAIYRK